ncbi:MAG TPA: flagellar hook-length control protein FliK [Syntrophales bacterium]|nr:flagellar hook-length control protein FliK [Syntrophales bacterium]
MSIDQITGIASQLLIKAIQQRYELQGFPQMQPGESLEAQVLQKLDGNKVVVMIKGAPVTAETTIPLQVGQKINVQVETLQPQILLRLTTGTAEGGETQAADYLKVLRAPLPAAAPLQLGETLEAQVAQKLDAKNVVVMIKGVPVAAETTIPLQAGQKINVEVQSLRPQILLRLVAGDTGGERARIAGYLKVFRAGPQAMTELFQSAGPLFSPDSLKTLSHSLLRDRSQALGQMIRTLIFSTETMKNPLFVRDFVARAGFLLEHNLGKALTENSPGALNVQSQGDNLKSALIDLSAGIRTWLDTRPDIPEAEAAKLLRLAEYADRSVRTLETQQVLNVVAREQDNRFMVQVPFAFSQGPTMQDIFIEFGGSRGEEEREAGAPFRVVFFLDLDALGEMMIDVGISGQDLTADLSCQKVDTVELVSSSLEELRENLDSLGFRVMRMTCDVRDDITLTKQDYVRNSSWYEGDVINFFA